MDWSLFFIYLCACGAAAATGALFPTGPWYEALKKPSWTPPNWLFPVAWTSLYVLMSLAAARAAMVEGAALGLALWSVQIAFNTLWTPVFFGLKRMRASLVPMAGLWLSVTATCVVFFTLDVWAGLMFVPYVAWVTVAGALNLALVRLNPEQARQATV
ncbi:MAG: tryptophan-rich sensory protein [Tabrizicola sp.]|jgi:tryptophan-rich sensory protein|nr:tryptophan-rich sensory protein [Tabrizicola sp.]